MPWNKGSKLTKQDFVVDVTGGIEIHVRSIIHRCRHHSPWHASPPAAEERARRVTGELQDLSVPELKKKAKVPTANHSPGPLSIRNLDGCFHLPKKKISFFSFDVFCWCEPWEGLTRTGFLSQLYYPFVVHHQWTSTMKESKIHMTCLQVVLPTHRIHGTGMFSYIWLLIFMVNIAKYTIHIIHGSFGQWFGCLICGGEIGFPNLTCAHIFIFLVWQVQPQKTFASIKHVYREWWNDEERDFTNMEECTLQNLTWNLKRMFRKGLLFQVPIFNIQLPC